MRLVSLPSMILPRHAVVAGAIALAFTLPASAVAEPVVPPGNSAAAQYTETLPTSGGQAKTGDEITAPQRSPKKVLGVETTRELDEAGPAGAAVADFAAATAPETSAAGPDRQPEATRRDAADATNPAGSSPGGELGGARTARLTAGDGSSATAEVASQATGLAGVGSGALLLLVVAAALVWALAFALRERRRLD